MRVTHARRHARHDKQRPAITLGAAGMVNPAGLAVPAGRPGLAGGPSVRLMEPRKQTDLMRCVLKPSQCIRQVAGVLT